MPTPGTTLSQWQISSDPSGKFVDRCGHGHREPRGGCDRSTSRRPLRYTISVSVWDGYVRSAPGTVTINVTNVNDNAPSVSAGPGLRHRRRLRVHDRLAREAHDADDINQPGFTTFSGLADRQRQCRVRSSASRRSAGELQIARPLLIDWSKTSYTLLVTAVSDGANTSAADAGDRGHSEAGRHVPARTSSSSKCRRRARRWSSCWAASSDPASVPL